MKRTLLLLISILLHFFSLSQAKISFYEKKSFDYKRTNLDSFFYYKNLALKDYEEQKNIMGEARCLQSLGFTYEEDLKDFFKAFYYISSAIEKYKIIKDTLSEANLDKYIGIIYSNLGASKIGIIKVNDAIKLFKEKKYPEGEYVSFFDLGIIYYNTQNIDSSINYLNMAKKFWTEKNTPVRVFAINNYLIRCYKFLNVSSDFNALILENNLLLKKENIPKPMIDDFNIANK